MPSFVLKAGTAALAVASVTSAVGPYTLADADLYQGSTFFDKFNFINNDPNRANHGFVNYLTRAQANSTQFGGKLVDYASDGSAYIGVDHWNTRPDGAGGGRPSVRIESTISYTHGLFIADIAHMPGSACGLWPAFWTTNPSNWPDSGEIDILENINEATTGVTTFHTGAPAGTCTATGNQQSGHQTSTNCNDPATSNQGCSATNTDPNSYGTTFNAAGGGVYALEWTSTSVKVWNWERGNIPTDILSGAPVPANWGLPITSIDSSTCGIDNGFTQHSVIFNTNFCGDWAGQTGLWQQTSCYKSDPTKYTTCNLYAGANPQAYAEAYWKINSLKVYKTDNVIKAISPSTSSASVSKVAPTSAVTFSAAISALSPTTLKPTPPNSSPSIISSSSVSSSAHSSPSSASPTFVLLTPASSPTPTTAKEASTLPITSSTGIILVLPSSSTSISLFTLAPLTTLTTTKAASTFSSSPSSSITLVLPNSTPSLTEVSTLPSSSSSVSATLESPVISEAPPSFRTLTIFTTLTSTILSCPPTVISCPIGSLTTKTILLSTTICPVSIPSPTPTLSLLPTTSTILTTTTSTIISCHPSVTNCPIGSITTQTLTLPAPFTLITSSASPLIGTPAISTSESTSTSTTTLPFSTKTLSLSLVQVSGTASSFSISTFAQPTETASVSQSPNISTALASGVASGVMSEVASEVVSGIGSVSAVPNIFSSASGGNVTATLSKPSVASTTASQSLVPFTGGANREAAGSFLGIVFGAMGTVFLL